MEAISRASASEPDCARYQIFGTLPSDAVARSSRDSAADPDDAASIAETAVRICGHAIAATAPGCEPLGGPWPSASATVVRTPPLYSAA